VRGLKRLLLDGLERHPADVALLRCNVDRPGIGRIVLVADHEGLDQARGQQLDLVAQGRECAPPVMGPPQASMAMRPGWRWAKKSASLARASFLRRISPLSGSIQCTWNTFFAISTP
jgi:hypothetical protein